MLPKQAGGRPQGPFRLRSERLPSAQNSVSGHYFERARSLPADRVQLGELVEHLGIAPSIPVWKTGVYLSTHLTLAKMGKLFSTFQLITQNVDGLHQRGGSSDVIELHGNITRTKCFDEDIIVSSWPKTDHVPPKCPRCGGLLRPDVVWFEEAMPENEMFLARQASTACDIFFAIGTSAMVQPAASLPLEALYHGATLVEINPQRTSLTGRAHFALSGSAGSVLPDLIRRIPK